MRAGHLSNDKDPDAEKTPVAKPEAKPAAKPDEKKGADDKPPARIEYGTKEDFQFMQAMNLLKGQPVQGEKSTPQTGDKTAAVPKK